MFTDTTVPHLLETGFGVTVLTDATGRVLGFDAAFTALWGESNTDGMTGSDLSSWLAARYPEAAISFGEALEEALRNGLSTEKRIQGRVRDQWPLLWLRCRRMEGAPTIVLVRFRQPEQVRSSSATLFAQQPFAHHLFEQMDALLADQHQTEQRLKAAEQLFINFMRHFNAVAFLKDDQGRFLYINPCFERIFKVRQEDWKGHTDRELGIYSEEVLTQLEANDRLVLESGEALDLLENVPALGVMRHWQVVKFPCPLEDGATMGVGGVALDITELVRAREEAQRNADAALQRERESAALLAACRIVLDKEEFSEAAEMLFILAKNVTGAAFGYISQIDDQDRDQVVFLMDVERCFQMVDPQSPAPIRGLRVEACRQGKIFLENNFVNSHWSRHLPADHPAVDNVLFAPIAIDGHTLGMLALANKPGGFTASDVAIAKGFGEVLAVSLRNEQVNTSLKESEERFRNLFDNAGDGILVAHPETHRFLMANPSICRMLGYTAQELVGMGVENIHQASDLPRVYHEFSRLVQGETQLVENIPILKKDGAQFHADISAFLLKVKGVDYLVGFFRDITERKAMEGQLRHAQKMQALGVLAGGISHDFNNILAIIVGNAELAHFETRDSEVSLALTDIIHAAKRGRDLVSQLLAFSRRSVIHKEPLFPVPMVKEALRLMRATLPSSIKIYEALNDPVGAIHVDPTQFHQVVMNLCSNAGQAMGERGGLLEVSLKQIVLEPERAAALAIAPGPYCELRVRDNGPGIPAAIQERIFEPFFTTKPVNEGTGLGLAVVHSVVQESGGVVLCESVDGRGVVFRLYFPIVKEGRKVAPPSVQNATPLVKGRGRILFVDDEIELVKIGKKILKSLGYDCYATTDPLEALELFVAEAELFAAVITDQIMPKMTGDLFANKILERDPQIPIFLTTGFSQTITQENAKSKGFYGYFSKPLAIHDLAAALKEATEISAKRSTVIPP